MDKLNPELIKKCAEMAIPTKTWKVLTFMGLFDWVTVIGAPDDSRFDPIKNPADHDALVDALLKQGWEFSRTDWPGHERYKAKRKAYAGSGEFRIEEVINESRPLCTLKAVAAQTGIELEAK